MIKNSRLAIYLKLVSLLYCMASSVRVILGDPAELVVRMLNVRPRDILGQKYTSGAREPVENHQSNSSRSVRNRSR